jgi:hypothetical protein
VAPEVTEEELIQLIKKTKGISRKVPEPESKPVPVQKPVV